MGNKKNYIVIYIPHNNSNKNEFGEVDKNC